MRRRSAQDGWRFVEASSSTAAPSPAAPHPGAEQAYIQKPFTASQLAGKVRAALAAAATHPPGPAG